MNTKQIFTAALVTLAGSSAFAQAELQFFGLDQANASATRAEVRAETRRAVASGELLVPSEVAMSVVPKSTSQLTRAEVRRDTAAAVARGEIVDPLIAQQNIAPTDSQLTRQAVREEARQYTQSPHTVRNLY